MGIIRKLIRRGRTASDQADYVHHTGSGNWLTAIVSALALIFSFISLYETVLRRPELSLYVPPVIYYTQENNREVFVLPVTITNSGARDGIVLSLGLQVRRTDSDQHKSFYSAFFAEREYFTPSRLVRNATGGLQIAKNRMKRPFAPLSIPGQGHYSGALLFFAHAGNKSTGNKTSLVSETGNYTLTLTLKSRPQNRLSWFDRLFTARLHDLNFEVTLARYNFRVIQRGDLLELRRTDPAP